MLAVSLSATPAAALPEQQDADYLARYEVGHAIAAEAQAMDSVAEQVEQGFRIGIEQAKTVDPNLSQIESEFPGLLDAFADDGAAIMVDSAKRRLPSLWSDLANLYARELSLDQIRAMASFYGSPVGRKLIKLSAEGVDLEAHASQVLTEGVVSAEAQMSMTAQGEQAALRAMTKEEQAEVAVFMQQHGATVMRVSPEAMAITNQWINAPLPPRDQAAMGEALQRHLAARQTGASGK